MGKVLISTARDRIVRVMETTASGPETLETYLYQALESDFGGGQRWVEDTSMGMGELAFGFTQGWGDLHPLWPKPFFGSDKFRDPQIGSDVLLFEVTPMGRYLPGYCDSYLVAFGAWDNGSGTIEWEHRQQLGLGAMGVAKRVNSRLFGDVVVGLGDNDADEICQVLLKLRCQLEERLG